MANEKRRNESEEDYQARVDKLGLEDGRQVQLNEDIRLLLEDDGFLRVMSEFISYGQIFQSSFTGNSTTFHNIGKQDLAKQILMRIAKVDKVAAFDLLKPKHANME